FNRMRRWIGILNSDRRRRLEMNRRFLICIAAMLALLAAERAYAQCYPYNCVLGRGTPGRIPVWTDRDGIGDSDLFQRFTNIGIGTTNPEEKLVINGGNTIARIAINSDSPTANAGIRLLQDGVSRWSVATVNPDGDFQIYEDDIYE